MPRDFTSKDAKNLIQEYTSLINAFQAASRGIYTIINTMQKNTEKLIDRQDISFIVKEELINGHSSRTLDALLMNTITGLFQYINGLPSVHAGEEAYDTIRENARDDLSLVNYGRSGITWALSSKKRKEAIQAAYDELQTILHSEAAETIRKETALLSSLQENDADTAWKHYRSAPSEYIEALTSLAPNIFEYGKPLYQIQDLIKKHNKLLLPISAFQQDITRYEHEIRDAAYRSISQEAYRILSDISIDEIAKTRSGVRVKTLRDHGYQTVADIYSASKANIASIRGISYEMASDIKSAALEMASNTKGTLKLKLDSDHKTKAANALVKRIYDYKKALPDFQRFFSFQNEYGSKVAETIRDLENIGNGLPWVFLEDDEKQAIRAEYQYLTRLLDDSDYKKQLSQIKYSILPSADQKNVADAWNDFGKDSVAYFNILEKIVPELLGNSDSEYGLPEELAREIQAQDFFPDGLNCELRRYQEWGVKYILHQQRVLLGDEMGLGKTIQAIATMVSLRNTGATHFFIVCPASVLPNWCKEIAQKSKLRVTKVHGLGRDKALTEWFNTGGAAVTTYETISSLDFPEDFRFDLIIVDEAHYIKNASTRRAVNVKKLCLYTSRMLFMTGTALENKVDEMVALIDILQPEVAFQIRNLTFMASAPQFREKIAPVYYRRKREDVLTELPDKTEKEQWCTLSGIEEDRYEEAVLSKNLAAIRRVSWNTGDLKYSSKARRLKELVRDAEEDGRKVILFSFFLDTIKSIQEYLGDRCRGPINGSVSPQKRQEIIDDFENAPAGSVLLAQILAGGTGLNIQSASVVILCEPQFKPSIENQAIARAHRMGQTRNVLVYRLLCENTVDERFMELLAEKQAIFDAFADEAVASAAEKEDAGLDNKAVGKIIEDEIARINEKHQKKQTGPIELDIPPDILEDEAGPEPQQNNSREIPAGVRKEPQPVTETEEELLDRAVSQMVMEYMPDITPYTPDRPSATEEQPPLEVNSRINFCFNCGAKQFPNAKFCHECGTKLP